jgi:hypothetical protein
MQLPIKNRSQELTSPQLPLAVYREIAAHLRQVAGVETSLIIRPLKHEPGAKFDYYQSQVAALEINYPEAITVENRQRVTEILDHYAQRYNPWETRQDN